MKLARDERLVLLQMIGRTLKEPLRGSPDELRRRPRRGKSLFFKFSPNDCSDKWRMFTNVYSNSWFNVLEKIILIYLYNAEGGALP